MTKILHSRTAQFLKSLPFILVFYGVCLVGLVLAVQAKSATADLAVQAAKEAEVRAAAFEAQNERMRLTFCGVFERFAYGPTASTDSGKGLQASFKFGASSDGLGCTPDPLDGK